VTGGNGLALDALGDSLRTRGPVLAAAVLTVTVSRLAPLSMW
jgi:hypothetical protein